MYKIIVPQEMPNDDKFSVVKLHAKNGDYVKVGAPLFDLESSKAIFTLQAESEGYLNIGISLGDEVSVGDVIGVIDAQRSTGGEQAERTVTEQTIFSKEAIKMINERQIDASIFANHSFVDSADVAGLCMNGSKGSALSGAKLAQISALSVANPVPITSTLHMEIKCKGLLRFTKKNHELFKFSFTPLIVHEAAKALKKFEFLNAYFDNNSIVPYEAINIGYAIDNDKGLKVATINNADKMTLNETEKELFRVIEAYNNDTLSSFDMRGSTFSITDLSFDGVTMFTPLINGRQGAILGIGCVGVDGECFYLSLTFDHRVSDGRYAAGFLKEIKTAIEGKLEV